MRTVLNWLITNKEWVFSGIGIFIIGLFFTSKAVKRNKQKQKLGDNSFGIQANGDVKININKDEENE
ncbi:MAG: hypothetical protein MJ231_06940 [bacterium]|nr:hypothetical protein [bacterium]